MSEHSESKDPSGSSGLIRRRSFDYTTYGSFAQNDTVFYNSKANF